MKILILNKFNYSGQTTHVFYLTKKLLDLGHRVHLVMTEFPEIDLEYYKSKLKDYNISLSITGNAEEIGHLIKKYDSFDVIHAHSALTYRLANYLSRKHAIPLVLTCHGLGIKENKFSDVFKTASSIICISPRIVANLSSYQDKISLIPNGIDTEEFRPNKKKNPVKIAYVSRVDRDKAQGFNALNKAISLIYSVNNSFEFHVASNVKPLINRAKYLGWVVDPAKVLRDTDIIIGTGLAVIEGMSAGNAALVLGNKYGGIINNNSPLIQKSDPDFSGLAGKDICYRTIFFDLARLIKNKSYLNNIQIFSREYIEKNFNLNELTKDIVSLYSMTSDS